MPPPIIPPRPRAWPEPAVTNANSGKIVNFSQNQPGTPGIQARTVMAVKMMSTVKTPLFGQGRAG